jgi:hypothetical protein
MNQSPTDRRTPELLVEIALFETKCGGRHSPIVPPHFTGPLMLDNELFTCRIYLEAPVYPGDTFRAKLRLLQYESLADRMVPGCSFTLWEGHPIANGVVITA